MATPLRNTHSGCSALLFAYTLTGLSLCTWNSDTLARRTRDLMTGITETARAAAPTERLQEKTRQRLRQQTQRMAQVFEQLRNDDLGSEKIRARQRASLALVLLAAGERLK
jgi:hypothetical protein